MGWEQHPLFLGPHDTPLRGEWVRSLRTDMYGYIAHVERPRNRDKIVGRYSTEEDKNANKPRLWIVYPPDPALINTWSAGSALPQEVKRQKWPNYFEEEE